MVAGPEIDFELDPTEERRGREEDDPVGAGVGVCELPDAPVDVGLAGADELLATSDAEWDRLKPIMGENDPTFNDATFDPFEAAEEGFDYLACVTF